jgi:putative DNA primase/helicase
MGLLGAKPGINACRRLVEHKAEFIQPFANVNARGNPLCTLENLRQLLNSLGYGVRYNVIRKCIEFNIPGTKFLRDNRENASYSHILNSCEKVGMPTKHVHQYLITLADENPFNPVATWIESVPWDGVSRLDSFYETVISVGDQSLKKTLLRKWMVQAVAAAFSPDGIPAQGVLTFVGAQNIGKTTWFKRLAPNELDVILTGHTLDTRNKDSVFIALSYWMVELGEVDATFRKSDIAALKSFLTQPLDKLRRPYAATESSFGRRTVFGATVNEEQYLHDPTGNRRFWSIEVEKFVLDHELNMQQVWAEVLTLWRAGETFSLSREEIEALNSHNEQYTAVDPIEEKILSGFQWGSADTCQWLTATQILERLGIPFPTKGQTSAAGRVLKRCCHGGRKKSNGVARYPVPRQSEFDGLDFFQGQGNTG